MAAAAGFIHISWLQHGAPDFRAAIRLKCQKCTLKKRSDMYSHIEKCDIKKAIDKRNKLSEARKVYYDKSELNGESEFGPEGTILDLQLKGAG